MDASSSTDPGPAIKNRIATFKKVILWEMSLVPNWFCGSALLGQTATYMSRPLSIYIHNSVK